jgi:hypothetical protein
MADALRAGGFTDEEIATMIVANSRLLAGADPACEGHGPGEMG